MALKLIIELEIDEEKINLSYYPYEINTAKEALGFDIQQYNDGIINLEFLLDATYVVDQSIKVVDE